MLSWLGLSWMLPVSYLPAEMYAAQKNKKTRKINWRFSESSKDPYQCMPLPALQRSVQPHASLFLPVGTDCCKCLSPCWIPVVLWHQLLAWAFCGITVLHSSVKRSPPLADRTLAPSSLFFPQSGCSYANRRGLVASFAFIVLGDGLGRPAYAMALIKRLCWQVCQQSYCCTSPGI